MTRPPIVGREVWEPVVKRAGGQCQCAGQCGRKHNPSGERPIRQLRCPHTSGLLAAPVKPTDDPVEALSADLMAWCPACYDDTRAAARRARRAAAAAELLAATDTLF